MINQRVDEFLADFSEDRYPVEFVKNYELLECLSHNEQGETLLVRDKQTDEFLVAKCYTDQLTISQTSESVLLQNLHNERFPAFIREYQNDGMTCVLREYVNGITLDQYTREHLISKDLALSICVKLCDDLIYLHGQTPPVIHRDIKPQNVVIDDQGNPRLIDFGNSRLYDENAQMDTVCFGTRHFAAPEQYGFSQTDGRTDIFALGVLLCWMLTGQTDIKEAIYKINDRQLKRIIKKCTEFAPEKRYSSALRLKADLLLVIRQVQTKIILWAARVAVSSAFVVLGFTLGRFTDFSLALFSPTSVRFKEPLIEQAVRLELGKQTEDAITKDDLLSITEIYVCGDQAVSGYAEFEDISEKMATNEGTLRNGGISTLEDLSLMPNLQRINISLENISDLSPLSNLDKLEQILLKHNPIEDVAPLAGLPSLKELFLFDTKVSDLSSLSACPMLRNIDIGATYISSMAAFSGIKNLTYLDARKTSFTTLSGIEDFQNLQQISLGDVMDDELSPLLALPQLKTVYLQESMRESAQSFLAPAQFDIIFE